MVLFRSTFLPILFVALTTQVASAGYAIGDLRQYDLVVVNNLTSTSEVEGRTLIGGSILAGNSSNYGIKLSSAGYSSSPDNLVVSGNINASVNANYGNVLVGGTGGTNSPNFNNFVNGGNQNGGVTVITQDAAVQNLAATIQSKMNSSSSYLASLAANSSYSPTSSFQNATVTFNASPVNGVAVFNIPGSLLNGQGLGVQSYALNANGASSIIFNVTGGSAASPIVISGNFTGGGFGTGSVDQDVLWNFYQATGNTSTAGIQFKTGFDGSILAPTGYLSNSGSAINGSVFTYNFNNQSAEVHYANSPTTGNIYQGIFLPTSAVPEPSSIASTLAGLALVGAAAWRRRRAS